jgi:hypothetical protein
MLENLETRFTYQPLIGNRLRHGKFISDVQYMTSGFSQIHEDGSLVVRETHSIFFLFFCIAKKQQRCFRVTTEMVTLTGV